MAILLALAATAASPQPGELKTFKNWIVGCDNGRNCKTVALTPDDTRDRNDFLRLALVRNAEVNAQPVLTIDFDPTKPGVKMALILDGRPFTDVAAAPDRIDTKLVLTGAQIRTLANGTTATIGTARTSLAGLSAALRYIDDRQFRVGTITAMIATGSATTPVRPAAIPVITAAKADKRPPRAIGAARAAQLIGRDNAVCKYALGKIAPEAYRLDARHSLVMIDHPCGNGAYNMFTSAYIVDENGRVAAAQFDTDKPNPKDGENMGLVNSGYNPETRRLSSFIKGRGLGDCGSGQDYVWDGTRFRLVEQTDMGECRGSLDYIRTWQARVVPELR